ncbi:MAG: cohesin domain-containing protein [Candidatus Eisenbacteria bacterium]
MTSVSRDRFALVSPTRRAPSRTRACRTALVLLVLGLPVLGGAVARAGGVPEFHAFLTPEVQGVELGDPVDVHFDVDSTAEQFNGYELRLQWDPSMLQLDSVDGGALMENACGTSPWENLESTDSTLTFAHVILCAAVALDGPGRLSTFHFEAVAAGTTEVVITSMPDRTFLDAGLWIWPSHPTFPRQVVFLHNALVVVTDPNAGIGETTNSSPIQISVLPNPVRDSGRIVLEAPTASPLEMKLIDVAGRTVWTHRRDLAPAAYETLLPRSDRWGRRLAAGTYLLQVKRGQYGERAQRVQVVR